ncbi:MAG: vWA domain-containing protein [Acidobacteriota bacterium]|nr:vWA domain-containing protein [Acidobacteriota bacterium]
MALVFEPTSPWHLIATGLLILTAAAALARGPMDGWRTFGRLTRTRVLSLGLTLLAAFALGLACWNPYFVKRGEEGGAHLVVLLDTSDSALRVADGWDNFQRRLARRMDRTLARMPAIQRKESTVDLYTFGDGAARVLSNAALTELPDAVARLTRGDFAAGGHSDLAEAVTEAGLRIDGIGQGQGSVLLISDGNQTRGDVREAANQLARRGIPIHVISLESAGPELAITSADLPRQVHSGVRTHVRGVMRNSAAQAVPGTLAVDRNPGLEDDPEDPIGSMSSTSTLDLEQWSRLRQEVVFEGYGLQYLDLTLGRADGVPVHRRRFFTHVNRPPHILAVGGDFRWVRAFPKSAAKIEQLAPEDITGSAQLREQDAIVISAVTADRFSTAAQEAIVKAVTRDGVGLMIINGDHSGFAPDAETVIMSYKETLLEDLLPVRPGPRPSDEEIERNVVLMLDTSGSMAGRRIILAKEIATHIVGNLLLPNDRLDIITFTRGAAHPMIDTKMTDINRAKALEMITDMSARGGTDPGLALQMLANRNLKDCGLIFISDGEFGPFSGRPDCRATVFAIGKESVPPTSPLYELADPFPVAFGFNPASIRIPYFNPEPRDNFYEPGSFRALAIERYGRGEDVLPMPALPLNGDAISYIRDDTVLIAVRPKLTDPILAYRRAGLGYVGCFTSGFPESWLRREDTQDALVAWISRLLAYTARDRYDFKITDRGETLELEIDLLVKDGKLPRIESLGADIEIAGSTPLGIAMRPDDLAPGSFSGRVRIPRTDATQKAVLHLKEVGPDALSRTQRIPFLIPRSGLVTANLGGEAFSYGTNEPLLRAVANMGGGLFNPAEGAPLFRRNPVISQGNPLWPPLLVVALTAYLIAFGVRRFDP